MASYNKFPDQGLIEPRDPSAIAKRSDFGNLFSLVVLLLVVAVAIGFYVYAGAGSALPTVAAPPVTQLSPPAPAPATQPPTQS